MRRIIPRIAGSISVAFYLAFVLYLYLDAKHCAEMDGLLCGFGILVAGFPWNWVLLSLADLFMPEHQFSIEQKLYWGTFSVSVIANSFIFYFVGCFIGRFIVRLRANIKFSGAT